jgi:hypothetical protein
MIGENKPQSWIDGYQLPNKTESDIDDIYQSLMESLFHMPDEEAEKIKYQYLLKYPFLDAEKIKAW